MNKNEENNRSRFSHKADDYVKYRPAYPTELLEFLKDRLGVSPNNIIADIGSGTGISSSLFIAQGNTVYGVEPNPAMRKAAEEIFSVDDNFISIDGSGEKTNLASASIDIIFSGQAFHWFNKAKAKIEFNRILKPGGHIVLAWNIIDESDPIGLRYQQILKENIEGYTELQDIKIAEQEIEDFFSPRPLFKTVFKNYQYLDLPGFLGRIRSSSLVPNEGDIYNAVIVQMEILFKEYALNGLIKFAYQTKLYWS